MPTLKWSTSRRAGPDTFLSRSPAKLLVFLNSPTDDSQDNLQSLSIKVSSTSNHVNLRFYRLLARSRPRNQSPLLYNMHQALRAFLARLKFFLIIAQSFSPCSCTRLNIITPRYISIINHLAWDELLVFKILGKRSLLRTAKCKVHDNVVQHSRDRHRQSSF